MRPRWANTTRASQLNPSLATPALRSREGARGQRRGPTTAVARARTGLAIDPASFYGHYTLGVVHQRAQRWPDAFVAFGRAVELNGREPRARANLASTAMRLRAV